VVLRNCALRKHQATKQAVVAGCLLFVVNIKNKKQSDGKMRYFGAPQYIFPLSQEPLIFLAADCRS
jgi:hypothetical protein